MQRLDCWLETPMVVLGFAWLALWFTIVLLTTIGSDYWPKTPEGRVLCILLSVYAIGVFGYIAASLASFFVDRDAESEQGELAGEKSVAALRE